MMHVLVVVAECHRIDGIVRSGYNPALQDFLGRRAMWPRSRLRCVGERQPGGVDDTVTPHQRYGNLRKKNDINKSGKNQKRQNGMKMKSTWVGPRTHCQPERKAEISGTTHSIDSSQRNMVSASTSPNHTFKLGVRFSPISSNMATSPPPFNYENTKKKRQKLNWRTRTE